MFVIEPLKSEGQKFEYLGPLMRNETKYKLLKLSSQEKCRAREALEEDLYPGQRTEELGLQLPSQDCSE